jgi:IS5 family transposase
VLRFRRLLEAHQRGVTILEGVVRVPQARGLRTPRGTIVNATNIAARSFARRVRGKRDSEMQQTKNGWQWRLGMKVHVGFDAHSKVIYSAVTSTANEAHGKAPAVRDFTNRKCKWKQLNDEAIKSENGNESRIGSRAEHSIGVTKRVFRFQPEIA